MDDFERQIHAMFDHIWDCEIDHPAFQDTVGELMSAVIQCHKNTPSTQPERKKGHWIIKDNPGTGWYRVMCSECGIVPAFGFFPNAKVIWKFCPDCGADMRGGQDE